MSKFFANKIFGDFVDAENLDHEFYQKIKPLGDSFTLIVDFLRTPQKFPNPLINCLMTLVWDVVGYKIVPVAMAAVPTPGFFYECTQGQEAGVIMLPPHWNPMGDPIMANGAVTMCGSKALDFYNGKFDLRDAELRKAIEGRAKAYEADLLLTCQQNSQSLFGQNKLKLNEYQRHILGEYPEGWKSLKESWKYESKPFIPGPISPFIAQIGDENG